MNLALIAFTRFHKISLPRGEHQNLYSRTNIAIIHALVLTHAFCGGYPAAWLSSIRIFWTVQNLFWEIFASLIRPLHLLMTYTCRGSKLNRHCSMFYQNLQKGYSQQKWTSIFRFNVGDITIEIVQTPSENFKECNSGGLFIRYLLHALCYFLPRCSWVCSDTMGVHHLDYGQLRQSVYIWFETRVLRKFLSLCFDAAVQRFLSHHRCFKGLECIISFS